MLKYALGVFAGPVAGPVVVAAMFVDRLGLVV